MSAAPTAMPWCSPQRTEALCSEPPKRLSARQCVTAAREELAQAHDIDDLARAAEGFTVPETGEEGFGRLYAYVNSAGGEAVDWLIYIECRPLAASRFLVIRFLAPEDVYEDGIATYDAVIETLDLAGAATANGDYGPATDRDRDGGDSGGPLGRRSRGGDVRASVLDGNTFGGDAFAFSVTWGRRGLVAGRRSSRGRTTRESRLLSEGSSALVEAFAGFEGTRKPVSTKPPTGSAKSMNQPGAGRDDLDLPAIDRAAETALYTYTYTGDDGVRSTSSRSSPAGNSRKRVRCSG